MKAVISDNATGPVGVAQADGEGEAAAARRPLRELMGDGLLDELLQRSLDEGQRVMGWRDALNELDTAYPGRLTRAC